MAKLDYTIHDKTLLEIDKALEQKQKLEKKRHYLGMSQIGEECMRKLFYGFRNVENRAIAASGLRAIKDGFIQEDLMAERLRMLPYIQLYTLNEETGEQIGFSLLLDHFRGHCDGAIRGIKEAPTTWHTWEHKSVDVSKFKKLEKLRKEVGEKSALKDWDEVYYAQAMIYMHEMKFERHYLTVTTPGGRDYISIRTEYKKKVAESIIEKAKIIIFDNWNLPAKLSEKREFYKCKWCDYQENCHDSKVPLVNCKTCRYREPVKNGKNNCLLKKEIIDNVTLIEGCPSHIYNPTLIDAKLIEHQEDGCLYVLDNGIKFSNTNLSGIPDLNKEIDFIYTSQELRNQIKYITNITREASTKLQKQVNGEITGNIEEKKAWNKQIDPRLKEI